MSTKTSTLVPRLGVPAPGGDFYFTSNLCRTYILVMLQCISSFPGNFSGLRNYIRNVSYCFCYKKWRIGVSQSFSYKVMSRVWCLKMKPTIHSKIKLAIAIIEPYKVPKAPEVAADMRKPAKHAQIPMKIMDSIK